MTESTDDIFGGEEDNNAAITAINELAKHVADEDEACAVAKKELTDRQAKLKLAKEQLYDTLQDAGMQNCKLDCGLNPSRNLVTKYFKAAGVDEGTLFDWLNNNSLGDIIKPTVHWGTLNSTMKEFAEQGHTIPEIINPVQEKGIRMNGKSKYLASKTAPAAE